MNEERFEERALERLKETARDYNVPPETPREAIWAKIETRREKERDLYPPGRLSFWSWRKLWWPAAAAGVLVLGIVIGRITVPSDGSLLSTDRPPIDLSREEPDRGGVGRDEQGPAVQESGEKGQEEPGPDRGIFQLAAVPVLSKAELLITQFRAGEATNGNGESFSTRAAALLIDTRLLLDSPAADDREFRALLSDLELILAQIVRITADGQDEERTWIKDNLKRRSILPRLRTKVPEGTLAMYL